VVSRSLDRHLTVVLDVACRFRMACSVLRWHATLPWRARSLNMASAWGRASTRFRFEGRRDGTAGQVVRGGRGDDPGICCGYMGRRYAGAAARGAFPGYPVADSSRSRRGGCSARSFGRTLLRDAGYFSSPGRQDRYFVGNGVDRRGRGHLGDGLDGRPSCKVLASTRRRCWCPAARSSGNGHSWSVPAFLDTGLGCQLTELPIS